MFPLQNNRAMEEFHDLCAQFHIEAKIEALPNPSDYGMIRIFTFQSFNDDTIRVILEHGDTVMLPARGTVQIMLLLHELPPTFERIE